MSYNPYQSPGYQPQTPAGTTAETRVGPPAVALIVISIISAVMFSLSLVIDIWMLSSGFADELQQPGGISKDQQILVRIAWGVLMIVLSAIILFGAIQMKSLQNYGLAKTACILALVPCCGPCFVLAIPFGIWGLIVLNDPQVHRAFRS